jgi:hypothetical protein
VAAVVVAAGPLALALVAGRAGARDASPLVLGWEGPSECEAAPRVVAGVRRLLGAEHGGAPLVVRAKVERAGKRWHLVLSTEAGGRAVTRALDAESCDAAADAAAVILALVIDPSRALEGPGETEGAPRAETDGGREPDRAPSRVDAGEAPDASRAAEGSEREPGAPLGVSGPNDAGDAVRLSLAAAIVSDTGTLPRTAFGFAGGLGLGGGHFRGEATFGYWPAVSTTVDPVASRGGSFAMMAATLRGCAMADAGILSFGPCAGAGLTRLHAEAFGVTTPIAANSTWGAFVADATLRARIVPFFSPRLSAGATIPFSRPTFTVVGLGPVHRPAAIALQIGAGVEVQF